MVRDYPGEKWKQVKFDFDFTNNYRLEVSNFGRLKSFNKDSNGNILNGTMVNGYRIVRLKFYTKRDEKVRETLNRMQQQVFKQAAKLKLQTADKESKKTIAETSKLLQSLKKSLHKKFMDDLKQRTINYHGLIHRLVADYFLDKPKKGETKVAHLDFNKLNNQANNLKWMAPQENFQHQQKSPNVIKQKEKRKLGLSNNIAKSGKLTVTKVMLLKKLLNQNKPVRQLVKQFKVTDMQIYRIKRGENWSNIQAAN